MSRRLAVGKRLRAAAATLPDPAFGEVCSEQPTGCFRCGAPLTGRRRRWCSDACWGWWHLHHTWGMARAEAMRRGNKRCVRCKSPADEVDHIIPRNGTPIHKPSCLHHQTNLRPLCHTCHVTRRTWEAT